MLQLYLSVILLFSLLPLKGQRLSLSEAEKFNFRSGTFEILGKENGLVYVHYYDRGKGHVKAYTSTMGEKWERGYSLNRKTEELEELILADGKFLLFFTRRDQNARKLYLQSLNLKFEPAGDAVLLDSTMRQGGGYTPYHFKHSEDRSKILIFQLEEKYNKDDDLFYRVINVPALTLLKAASTPLPTSQKSESFEDILVTDAGEVFVVLGKYDDNIGLAATTFRIFEPGNSAGLVDDHPRHIRLEDKVMNNFQFIVDNKNRNILSVGFYNDKNAEVSAEGIYFHALSMDADTLITNQLIPFDKAFIARIKGNKSDKHLDRLYSFIIDRILLRVDGGVVLIAESYFKSIRSRSTSVFYDPYMNRPIAETSVTYYFEDILAASIGLDGASDWKSVMAKSQVSNSDNGKYSSYSMLNSGKALHFIYNDEIRSTTNVVQYILDGTGDEDREVMFNSKKWEIMLLPQYGMQVSPNELVIPSYRRNRLRMVKLTF